MLVLCLLAGCVELQGPDGRTHKVMDLGAVGEATTTAATVANTLLPGSGVVVQGLGYLIAMIGLADRKKKGIPAP